MLFMCTSVKSAFLHSAALSGTRGYWKCRLWHDPAWRWEWRGQLVVVTVAVLSLDPAQLVGEGAVA
jgi:hypothetical protein